MRDTSIVKVEDLINRNTKYLINGKWVTARSEGFSSWRYRLKATWLVFTGKADAVIWPNEQNKL